MGEKENIHKELRLLEDIVDSISDKLHNTIGLLELIQSGIKQLNKQDDTYELSSIAILKEYLLAINNTDITKIQTMLTEIKAQL